MATSRLRATRTGLVTAITNQLTTDGVTGVTVTAYIPTSTEATREDRVWFDNISLSQQHMVMGGGREETLTVTGQIRAFKAGGSVTEQGEAEDRAEDILASVENAIRTDPDIASAVFHGQLVSAESSPDFDETGAIGRIEFTLSVEAHL